MITKNNHDWYECRIKYRKELEDGTKKKVSETYLVKADSVSSAEKRLLNEMAEQVGDESTVTSVKEASYKELFRNDEEHFYACKVSFIIYDEDSGTEKNTKQTFLVQADDFHSALKNLTQGLKGSISDYDIQSIAVTTVLDLLC